METKTLTEKSVLANRNLQKLFQYYSMPNAKLGRKRQRKYSKWYNVRARAEAKLWNRLIKRATRNVTADLKKPIEDAAADIAAKVVNSRMGYWAFGSEYTPKSYRGKNIFAA